MKSTSREIFIASKSALDPIPLSIPFLQINTAFPTVGHRIMGVGENKDIIEFISDIASRLFIFLTLEMRPSDESPTPYR